MHSRNNYFSYVFQTHCATFRPICQARETASLRLLSEAGRCESWPNMRPRIGVFELLPRIPRANSAPSRNMHSIAENKALNLDASFFHRISSLSFPSLSSFSRFFEIKIRSERFSEIAFVSLG